MELKFAMTHEGYLEARKWLEEHDLYKNVEHEDGFTVVYYANYKYAALANVVIADA